MRTVRRLVHHEAEKEAPDGLLLRLREIDPTLEVVYFGDGWWWVGSVRPNAHRRRIGEIILAAEERRSPANQHNVLLGRLALQGFAFICRYRAEGGLETDTVVSEDGAHVSLVQDIRDRHNAAIEDAERGEEVFRLRLNHHQRQVEANRARHQDLLVEGVDAFRSTLRPKLISIPTKEEVGHFSAYHSFGRHDS